MSKQEFELSTVLLNLLATDAITEANDKTAFDYCFTAIDQTSLALAQFRGNVILVVNTASLCGFAQQYRGLQGLWNDYRDDGLVVIGVPSNDFGWQEPGTAEEIGRFCKVTFGVTFPLTIKTRVRGADAHPFYAWARRTSGLRHVPRWNFHKYVVGRSGEIVGAFGATTRPRSNRLLRVIERELGSA